MNIGLLLLVEAISICSTPVQARKNHSLDHLSMYLCTSDNVQMQKQYTLGRGLLVPLNFSDFSELLQIR